MDTEAFTDTRLTSAPRAAPAWRASGFIFIFIISLAAREHGIAAKPFWMDEITTIQRASLPVLQMIRQGLVFHQLPAFFIVTSWALPLGDTEQFVRLPAMLFGALSCALAYGIARRLAGNAAGLAAGLLMAFSPAMVQYGQEARSYTMMVSAILIALWGLTALAQNPEAAAASLRRGKPWAWAAYILGTVAAINILSDALFWVLAANIGAVFIARHAANPRGFARNWLLAQLVILALGLPWYIAILCLGQRGAMGGLDWVQPLSAARLWWAISGTYLFYVTSLITVRIFPPGIPGFAVLVILATLAGLYRLRRGATLPVLAAAILVLPISLIAISCITPVLMPRYLLWSAAPFCIAAGIGLANLPSRLQYPALAALGLLAALNLRPYDHDETKPLWNLAATDLHSLMRPGDLLLTDDPQAIAMMNLYLARLSPPHPIANWTTNPTQAAEALAAGHIVWAVQGKVGQSDHENLAGFLQRIASLGSPVFVTKAGLDITILRFDNSAKFNAHQLGR